MIKELLSLFDLITVTEGEGRQLPKEKVGNYHFPHDLPDLGGGPA
jgi:hypothetical protein